MTDYTAIDLILEQNDTQGTAVPNGMNFGDFQTDIFKNYNPGVSSGNAYPWFYNLMPSGTELLSDYVIPASSSGFIPLSTLNFSDPYVKLVGTQNNLRVSLQTAVNLIFSVSTDGNNLNFTAYGYDQYKQKAIATTPNLVDSDTGVDFRILKDITAISYQNLADSPATITINIGYFYELRFFDLIQNSVLFATTGYPFYTAPASDEKMRWDFNYVPVATNPLVPLTTSAPFCRPIMDLTDSVNTALLPGNLMMVMQNVWGMGNFPNIPDYEFADYAPDLLNNLRTVIGPEQPSDGWVGWQG